MAKKALLDVLEQTIGKYVRNLDAESLNVAVWSGKIDLTGLELDVEACNAELDRQAAEAPNLAVPLRVCEGHFEHFQVEVPWTHLMSRPVIVRASGLQITMEPYDRTGSSDYLLAVADNEVTRAKKVQEQRQKSIALADDYRQKANALTKLATQDLESQRGGGGKDNNALSSNATFASRLVRRIVENLQVEIANIHVSLRGGDGCMGAVLHSLSLVTTDFQGKRTFVDRTAAGSSAADQQFLYKALTLQGLGLYIDETLVKGPSHLRPISEVKQVGLDHTYVLAPLSFEAKLRQADSNVCLDFPKYLLESELSSLAVLLSREQVQLATEIAQLIRPAQPAVVPLFPEYRPLARVSKETAQDWWRYAARCVGRLNGKRLWIEFFHAVQKKKVYIPLYKRKAHSALVSWLAPLTPIESDALEAIEKDRTISVEGLMQWRNIADAQVEKEQEKRNARKTAATSSIFTSLFGSSVATSEADEPPISLSVQELKELEYATLEQVADRELSNDSKLCDIKFVLGSLRVNMATDNYRQLAALEMGTVAMKFEANIDGSFKFDFSLASLEVTDKITPGTLYPAVLRNQDALNNALHVRLAKSSDGDQLVELKLNTFDAVASPLWLVELKRFLTLSNVPAVSARVVSQNPLLAQSLSGSVDLFYDASEGLSPDPTSSFLRNKRSHKPEPASASTVTDFSNVLVEAWKAKTAAKTALRVDFDLQAPILFVPENCTDPRATVVIFHMGHLRLRYGQSEQSSLVATWFDQNTRDGDRRTTDRQLDRGYIGISSLTLLVTDTRNSRTLLQNLEASDTPMDNTHAIIEPISMTVEFGVESTVNDEIPRACVILTLASILMNVSPAQLGRALSVYSAWGPIKTQLVGEDATVSPHVGNEGAAAMFAEAFPLLVDSGALQPGMSRSFPRMFVEVRLRRFSLSMMTEASGGIEAHLVSVSASLSLLSDGALLSRISMGWFWIVDRFENDFPRLQRLIAYSSLPVSLDTVAEHGAASILEQLESNGVFEDQFGGSSDLADISFRQTPPGQVRGRSDLLKLGDPRSEDSCNRVLDVRFAKLYLSWNPRAVQLIVSHVTKVGEFLDSHLTQGSQNLVIPSTRPIIEVVRDSIEQPPTAHDESQAGAFMVKTVLESIHLSLHSAIDDLPLFQLSMVTSKLIAVFDTSDNTKSSTVVLSMGDLRIETPEKSRTDPIYRTILGLSPGRSESLLSVHYLEGTRALAVASHDGLILDDCEAFGKIELSPMRMVHIQAQTMALVEYITAGILGSLAEKAAVSAASAASELATAAARPRLFCVKAVGFEVLLPRAANKKEFLSFRSGSLVAQSRIYPDSSLTTSVFLSELEITDTVGGSFQREPIQVDLNLSMPSVLKGTYDDQAMRATIRVGKGQYSITKPQYLQVLATLHENISEVDQFLRENQITTSLPVHSLATHNEASVSLIQLSHSGAELINSTRRIYVDFTIGLLSCELCNEHADDPIVRLAAENASVGLKLIPDQQTTETSVTLQNLVCDDSRISSLGKLYRSLMYQQAITNETSPDVFSVSYVAQGNATSVKLTVGSPRFVFIPDAISDILDFVQVQHDAKEAFEVQPVPSDIGTDKTGASAYNLEMAKASESSSMASLSIKLETGCCTVIFIDLGSDASLLSDKANIGQIPSVAETLVFQGTFHVDIHTSSGNESADLRAVDAQLHGEGMEVFTAFGQSLESAVQLLDPVGFSTYIKMNQEPKQGQTLDFRGASLSPVDFTISMRNLALITAILSSISLSFSSKSEGQESLTAKELGEAETIRIEQLAAALDSDEMNRNADNASFSNDDASQLSSLSLETKAMHLPCKYSLKLTAPDCRLTIVNDLQGLDEALLRVNVRNCVLGASVDSGRSREGFRPLTTFDSSFHLSILSDYFDVTTNSWKPLLLRPWEIASKARRDVGRGSLSARPSTSVDMECFPCCLSFSEQFLLSLASAQQMWKVYSTATASVDPPDNELTIKSSQLRRSQAASAVRSFIVGLPYAIENNSGMDIAFVVYGTKGYRRECPTGSFEYFRFEPPKANGSAGKRLYGQDITFEKTIDIIVGNTSVAIRQIDSLLEGPRMSHIVGSGTVIMIDILREGKTTVRIRGLVWRGFAELFPDPLGACVNQVVHVSSGIEMQNRTCISVAVSVLKDGRRHDIGVCDGVQGQVPLQSLSRKRISIQDGRISKASRKLGVPVGLMGNFHSAWQKKSSCNVVMAVAPQVEGIPAGWEVRCEIDVTIDRSIIERNQIKKCFDAVCRPCSLDGGDSRDVPKALDSFVFQVALSMILVDRSMVSVEIVLKPRAIIKNCMPVRTSLRTPMPRVYCPSTGQHDEGKGSSFDLVPNASLEIFTPGPSLAISAKCMDPPVGGTSTDWMSGWVDLPLIPEFRLMEPILCYFPFIRNTMDPLAVPASRGTEFFIAEESLILSEDFLDKAADVMAASNVTSRDSMEVLTSPSTDEDWRTYCITVSSYAVDHTGSILFQVDTASRSSLRRSHTESEFRSSSIYPSLPLGAYASSRHQGRISLIPGFRTPLRILYLTMEGDSGHRSSQPFCVDDVSICDGGLESTALKWEDGSLSGFYAYRQLISPYQSEIHVVPEYVVFNGSALYKARVKQPGGFEIVVAPGHIGRLQVSSNEPAMIAVEYDEFLGWTAPLQIDSLGLRLAIIKSASGIPIGSLAMQTVVGASDSRLVVKLSEVKFPSSQTLTATKPNTSEMLEGDFLRFRVQWSELRIVLMEARRMTETKRLFIESAMDRVVQSGSSSSDKRGASDSEATWVGARSQMNEDRSDSFQSEGGHICTLLLHRFTVDWQRVFKDDNSTGQSTVRDVLQTPERSQLSIIIHNVQIRDEKPGSPHPIVFDSTSSISFLDLRIRFRGRMDSDLVKVDLFDLNLCHSNDKSENMVVNASEEFVWKILDLADRSIAAASEFAGFDMELKWDDDHECYNVLIRDRTASYNEGGSKYTPPESTKLYHIVRAQVSPFTVVASFKRTPETSRYKLFRGGKGANIMNYFTRRLKFKIDKAELKFSRYEVQNVKGPPDRLFELLSTVYLSRMKFKLVTIMTAASFQDWKYLASRDSGDDEFVEGDILRVTGNFAGSTANYVFKTAGRKLGSGVARASNALGDTIESATSAIGVRPVGAGVNSMVSGVGEGVGEALSGVGTGAGKALKGAGQGLGHAFGGLTGGALMIGKGIGKGITEGDGRAVVAGISDGVVSVGTGVGQGVGSVVSGTADGVLAAGKGTTIQRRKPLASSGGLPNLVWFLTSVEDRFANY